MTRQLLIGACWTCRNSLLMLDEFNFSKKNKDDIRALLQLTEGGQYNRKLASFSAPSKEIDKDLSYSFENGEFNIKTRFSLIATTMKNVYNSQNIEVKALVDRSICIPFYPTKEEILKITIPAHIPIKRSTFSHIIKQAKITLEDFLKLI